MINTDWQRASNAETAIDAALGKLFDVRLQRAEDPRLIDAREKVREAERLLLEAKRAARAVSDDAAEADESEQEAREASL